MLKIYNSYTGKKEVFYPINPDIVKIYVCGMTVYDYCHIGHMRMLINFDVIIRTLKFLGYQVLYVRNITDIDDKIILRAQKNQENYQQLAQRFINYMHEDMQAFGLLVPDYEPKASDFIPQMLHLIQVLLNKNHAYVGENGDVFFSVRSFKLYGSLSNREVDDLASGSRVEINAAKRDPLDFVLWKRAKPHEPNWSSPWGIGRPGWHIECSAMSMHFLGTHFDLHGGGKDLMFPHHENEIAQAQAATEEKFVNIWLHNGHVEINQAKMSKSSANFLTVRELLKTHDPEVLRYFILTSHYRSPVQFSAQALNSARESLVRLYLSLRDLVFPLNIDQDFDVAEYQRFIAALEDDFNTPVALAELFNLARKIQQIRGQDPSQAGIYGMLLKRMGSVLGILQVEPQVFLHSSVQQIDVTHVEELIAARNLARLNKNWAEADRLRELLSLLSISLEDAPSGTKWRVST